MLKEKAEAERKLKEKEQEDRKMKEKDSSKTVETKRKHDCKNDFNSSSKKVSTTCYKTLAEQTTETT